MQARRSLVVVASQFPEPNETFIVRELAELRRLGFEVRVLSLRPPPPVVHDPEARALVPVTDYRPRLATLLVEAVRSVLAAPLAAARAVRRGLADVARALPTPVLAFKQAAMIPVALAYARRLPGSDCRLHAHFASLPTAVVRMLAAHRGAGYSFTAHAWDIFVPENTRQLARRIADADLVVTCTGYNRALLASLAPTATDAAKVTLCHHGLDLAAYEPGGEPRARLIVGGASLVEKKGLAHLVSACARLREQGLEFECLLIGEGRERARLELQIRELGLGDRVRLTGHVPHRELIGHLRRASVLAHPSIVDRLGSMDGIPNLVLEALAVETPVVATRLSGIPEVIVPEETGLLCEPGDADGLAGALARLLRDPPLARRLGRAGRGLVLERFDVTRNVERLAELLARPGRAPRGRPG